MESACLWSVCFYKLSGNEPRFFGFAEFLTALALMVLAWTITDARYRFRVRTAPVPVQRLTFGVVVLVGVLTLLTDLWRAEKWYVPEGEFLTPGSWQGLLGAVLLCAFLVWTWFAFIRPPHYNKLTAKQFGSALYDVLLRGDSRELSVVADELCASIANLVRHAPTKAEVARLNSEKARATPVVGYAHDIFQILADPRFVQSFADSASRTALEMFWEMKEQRRYPVGATTFGRNFITEGIGNRQSFIYRETEAHEAGLLGRLKPLTSTMYSSTEMVNALDLLDAAYSHSRRWDAEQLEAYGRLIVLTFRCYVTEKRIHSRSPMLYRAIDVVISSTADAYKLNGVESIGPDNDIQERLYTAVGILVDCVEVLDTAGEPDVKLRLRDADPFHSHTVYDTVAKAICEVIFHAAAVRGPRYTCWTIQHNSVWGRLFNFSHLAGPAGKIIKHKVRRLLYDDMISDMERFPNYKAAALVGFCLNILGHRPNRPNHDRDSRALQFLLVRWLIGNYVELHKTHPAVAEHCLFDDMSYDPVRKRILFARPGRLGQKKMRYSYLQLK